MKKKFLFIILAIVIMAMPMTAIAVDSVEVAEDIIAKPSGKYVKLDGEDIIMNAYLIKGSNYVKLSDIAGVLKETKAKFALDGNKITKGEAYGEEYVAPEAPLSEDKTAIPTEEEFTLADGKTFKLEGYKIDEDNYFRIRDLGKELEFGVAYDWTKNTILIDSEKLDIEDYKVVEKFEAPVNKIKTDKGEQDITFMIYGFEECPHCQNLKAFLDGKGIKYEMADIRLNDAKKGAIYEEFYTKFDREYDRVYYPTHVMTLEEDGKSISKAVVGFNQETYDEIFEKIENNTYFK